MPVKSEAQRKAMWAAENGHSTLGIPKSVAEKFVGPNAHDMTPGDWNGLIDNMRKFFAEEAEEGEHDDLDLNQLRDTLTKFFREEAKEPDHAEDKTAQDELPLFAILMRPRQRVAPDLIALDRASQRTV